MTIRLLLSAGQRERIMFTMGLPGPHNIAAAAVIATGIVLISL
jgi:hypothetical protein